VVIGHGRPEVSGLVNVVTDSDGIGRMAAEHLLACGFRHFAYCGIHRNGIEATPWSALRERSFVRIVSQRGYSCSVYKETSPDESWHKERHAIAQWLLALPKPLGVMACNDDRAQEVLEACKVAGLAVPETVGVIGVDNDEVVCGLANPPLSSVMVNFERAGYEAARALDALMNGRGAASQRIIVSACHVQIRRSTDSVVAENPALAKALRFIRSQAELGKVGVLEVVRASGISRRTLEKLFRHDLGHSILEEIRRSRTDRVAKLLIETQLPVSEIADALGFDDTQHFARYFRAAKRMSPVEYRKRYGSLIGARTPTDDRFPQRKPESLFSMLT